MPESVYQEINETLMEVILMTFNFYVPIVIT